MVGTWTYSLATNTITVTGGTEGAPCTFLDAWNADKAGTRELKASETYNVTGVDSLDSQPKPTDYSTIALQLVVTAVTGSWTIVFNGLDQYGNAVTATITGIVAPATYDTTADATEGYSVLFASVSAAGITITEDVAGSITFSVQQGQWGVVWKTATNHYQFDCRLVIGNGTTTTWLIDTLQQITFSSTSVSADSQRLIDVTNAAHLRLGQLDDATEKTTSKGCSIFSLITTYNFIRIIRGQGTGTDDVELYGCSLAAIAGISILHEIENLSGTPPIYNCTLDNVALLSTNADANRVTITRAAYGIAYATGTFDDMRIIGCQNLVYFYSNYTTNITTITGYNGTLGTFRCVSITTDKNITNGTFDAWTFSWGGGATNTAVVNRKYTFDLVTEPSATVTLKDKNGTQIFSVTADAVTGAIAQQTVTRGYYAVGTGSTLNDYSPHTLTITKTGYQTYTAAITIDEKIDWRIKLLHTIPESGKGGLARVRIKEVPTPVEEASLLLNTALLTKELRRKHP